MSLYRNVWPEAVYRCFTKITLFTVLFMIRVRDCYEFTSFVTTHLLLSEIALCIP